MEKYIRLPLDSHRWKKLNTFNNTPDRTPLLIEKLIKEPVNPTEPAINELTNSIFHQYGLADATYFVFPYLFDIHSRYASVNPRFFYLAANIAISTNIDQVDLPSEYKNAFRKTMFDFEKIAVSSIAGTDQNFVDVFNACKAALAFSGHCCGKLLMDILEREGTKRTNLICPQCQQRIRVMLFETGAVVMEDGIQALAPDPPVPIAKPKSDSLIQRDPNPWLVVERFINYESDAPGFVDAERQHLKLAAQVCAAGMGPNVSNESAFSLIGSIMLRHGFNDSAHRFFHLWDTVSCPKCKAKFIAATRWWGCVL